MHLSSELAHCTVAFSADEPAAVHLPESRLNAARTGRPTRSGGGWWLLVFRFLAPFDSFSFRVHASSFDSSHARTFWLLMRLELGPLHNLDFGFFGAVRRLSRSLVPHECCCHSSRPCAPRSTFVFGASRMAWLSLPVPFSGSSGFPLFHLARLALGSGAFAWL